MTVLAIYSCKAPSNKQEQKTKIVKPASQTIAINDITLNAIFPHYLALAAALVDDNQQAIVINSLAIEVGSEANKKLHKIKEYAFSISENTNLETQRKHFAALSTELIKQLKDVGLASGIIYEEYCPMAQNDKGAYWLSKNRKIVNPYYGTAMLDCGSVTDSLKPKKVF